MRSDRIVTVSEAPPIPEPSVLLVRLRSYIKTHVGESGLCYEGTCIKHPSADYRTWLAKVDHHDGCAVRWLHDSPFKTDEGLLDALLSAVAINESFCTEDVCQGQDTGSHIPPCLRTAVEAYLGWVRPAIEVGGEPRGD